MQFTGTSHIKVPKLTLVGFEFNDIVLDSLDTYSLSVVGFPTAFSSNSIVKRPLAIFQSGQVYSKVGIFVGTYNTGEPFSFKGWIDTNNGSYGKIDELFDFPIPAYNGISNKSDLVDSFYIDSPVSGTLTCNAKINVSNPINYTFTIPSYYLGKTVNGVLTCDTPIEIYGGNLQFYNSYEQLLTGNAITGNLYASTPFNIPLIDNDASSQDNNVNGVLQLNTLGGEYPILFNSYRGINTGEAIINFQSLNSGNTNFGEKFNYSWTDGKILNYIDSTGTINLQYSYSKIDTNGFELPKTVSLSLSTNQIIIPRRYLNSFTLTSSGEYKFIPTLKFTGYYYVTGFQNPISSFLFSSGCTGDLDVSYTNLGLIGVTNASGQLLTYPITLSGVYGNNINHFYMASGYKILSSGGRYTLPPTVVINTGKYGSSCFDVPLTSGKQAWFTPSSGYGAIELQAGYMTGFPLCTTGLVNGTDTGLVVTGIQITNMGSGFSSSTPPACSFFRQNEDNLIKNASGLLNVFFDFGSTVSYMLSRASVDYSIGNTGFSTYTMTDISSFTRSGSAILLDENNTEILFQISLSNVYSTRPWSATVTITDPSSSLNYQETITYQKTLSSDPNDVPYITDSGLFYAPKQEISFSLSSYELDTIYNSDSYVSEAGIDLGDVDF